MNKTSCVVIALALAACGRAEQADQADQADQANAATEVEVLPPDESVSTPGNQLAAGAAEPPANGAAANPEAALPAAMHGRWGLTQNDCQPGRSDATGLVTITADSIRFYESVARPDRVLERTDRMIRGHFAFIGEGMEWSSPMLWSVEGNRLTRFDSDADSRLVYTRC